MRKNKALYVLLAIVIGVVLGAVILRGDPPAPDTPDLPTVAIETE